MNHPLMQKTFLIISMICSFHAASAIRMEYGNNVIISSPVHEDLYVAGGTITINAPIHGDLIIAGGTININDTIIGDILIAGGEIIFNGFAGDDIRCAGGKIRISRNVAGDVVVTGGSIIIDKGITIGNLVVSGGSVTVDGNVNGEVKGFFGEFVLNGNVAKDITCRGKKITINGTVEGKSALAASDIIIGSNAIFNNEVRYWNRKGSLDFGQSLKNGNAIYDPGLSIDTDKWYYLGAATVLGLLWYLGMAFLLISIIQYLFSATMKKAGDTVFNNTWKSIGLGFLFFIAVPIAAVIALITVVGVPVGILLMIGYVALLLLATIITSVVTANWLNNRNNRQWNYWRIVFAALAIFIVLKILASIPFLGWLILFVMVCMAYGGIIRNVNWKGRRPSLMTAKEPVL